MKIMVCYDGSDSAKKALETTVVQAKSFNAEIIAVIALSGDDREQLLDLTKAEQLLDYARIFLTADGLKCETKVLSINGRSVGRNLVKYAEEKNVDEIVIGITKKSKVGKMLTGSTAQRIILQATCPVIAVK